MWTKPANTKAKGNKKQKNEEKHGKRLRDFLHFGRFETFTGKPHLDETSKNRGKLEERRNKENKTDLTSFDFWKFETFITGKPH